MNSNRTRTNKTIDRSVITVNQLRQEDEKMRFAFGRIAILQEKLLKNLNKVMTLFSINRKMLTAEKVFKVVKGINFNLPKKQQTILEQVLIDNITTGEFWDTLTESLNEDARSLSIVLPNLLYNLVGYVVPAT